MNIAPILEIVELTKIYKLYERPLDRMKEALHPGKKRYHCPFYALKNLSLCAFPGEVVGIIGKNGSGKSTLLQIVAGVLTPSSGQVAVKGKVSALLELGAGFDPELSGLENVYFQCSLQGYERSEVDGKIDEILAFADIGQFINQPVKTYSSGMFVRLAFAVAIHVEPEILIVDEALAVGDFRFQQKCNRRMNDFKAQNKTILFVSHDTGAVIEFCDRVIWLRDGEICASGPAKEICKDYISYMSYGQLTSPGQAVAPVPGESGTSRMAQLPRSHWQEVSHCESYGEGRARITRVVLVAKKDRRPLTIFEGGERVIFAIEIAVKEDLAQPLVGFQLGDAKGNFVLGMNSATQGLLLEDFRSGETRTVEFEFDFPYLKVADYSFSPAVASGTLGENMQQHWVYDAYMIRIASQDEAAKLGYYLVLKDNVEVRVS